MVSPVAVGTHIGTQNQYKTCLLVSQGVNAVGEVKGAKLVDIEDYDMHGHGES